MIRITVTGNTFNRREVLKDNKFRWKPKTKEWVRTVAEASLNHVLNELRPMRSWTDGNVPVIVCKLERVDINGKSIRNEVMGIKLMPEGDRVVDFLDVFQDFILSPTKTTPPYSEKKEKKESFDGFF